MAMVPPGLTVTWRAAVATFLELIIPLLVAAIDLDGYGMRFSLFFHPLG
jgi:hypothetical protein